MRKIIANAQAGFEGLRWLRDEAEVNGNFADYLKQGHYSEATLIAVKGLAKLLPKIDIRTFVPQLLVDDLDYMNIGAESIAVNNKGSVHKYLTGKTQEPVALARSLQTKQDLTVIHLGDMLAPTSIDVVEAKLFKYLPSAEYVRLTQPMFNIEYTDPHLNPELLQTKPEIIDSLKDFSGRLINLFEAEGLLMDVVNQGNLIWGKYDDNQPNQLYMIDTLPIDFASNDFAGIKIPFWNPNIHLESLVDFANTTNPGWLVEN